MKIRTLVIAMALSLLLPNVARADEGMWLLSLIGKNYSDMQKAGFKLTPEDIYSINQSCLKDAIVGLGNAGSPFWHFCTGEIISSKGLMSTNHHCGYGKLQEHSTVEHDYLRDGFWAYTLDQELPNPDRENLQADRRRGREGYRVRRTGEAHVQRQPVLPLRAHHLQGCPPRGRSPLVDG